MTLSEKKHIQKIRSLLISAYGHRQWKPRLDPVSELIQTILSQNTSDKNSASAFASLRIAFPAWDDIIAAPETTIAYAIREGGLSQVKAGYIKKVLTQIKGERGGFDLTFLTQMTVHEAREWLRQLPGVGMKTASCVLLFALGMPAFPVDTHVLRVTKRLGIVPNKATADEAHTLLESIVPEENIYELHMLLIAHGRAICKAQRPRCTECALGKICPAYQTFVSTH
jgi:endonuclease III